MEGPGASGEGAAAVRPAGAGTGVAVSPVAAVVGAGVCPAAAAAAASTQAEVADSCVRLVPYLLGYRHPQV